MTPHRRRDAVYTSTGLFWKALWAPALGYATRAAIQVFGFRRDPRAARRLDSVPRLKMSLVPKRATAGPLRLRQRRGQTTPQPRLRMGARHHPREHHQRRLRPTDGPPQPLTPGARLGRSLVRHAVLGCPVAMSLMWFVMRRRQGEHTRVDPDVYRRRTTGHTPRRGRPTARLTRRRPSRASVVSRRRPSRSHEAGAPHIRGMRICPQVCVDGLFKGLERQCTQGS